MNLDIRDHRNEIILAITIDNRRILFITATNRYVDYGFPLKAETYSNPHYITEGSVWDLNKYKVLSIPKLNRIITRAKMKLGYSPKIHYRVSSINNTVIAGLVVLYCIMHEEEIEEQFKDLEE